MKQAENCVHRELFDTEDMWTDRFAICKERL